MPLSRNRTDPSAYATWKWPRNMPPNFGTGFFGSYSRSSGFVHGTAASASTTMNVFDVPSGIDAR